MSSAPSLRFERGLLRAGIGRLAAVDEVGRGALSGPVTIGVVVLSASTKSAPSGVRDSKLLSVQARERLAPKIRRWADAWAVGHASAAEIDEVGLMAALRLAGSRALAALPFEVDHVLLDGNHDYLSPPAQAGLFGDTPADAAAPNLLDFPPVSTRIKADLTCAGVAAASILAKTERDAIMRELSADFPAYGWEENKGYAAPGHLEALAKHGATDFHRRSWSLPGVTALEFGDMKGVQS